MRTRSMVRWRRSTASNNLLPRVTDAGLAETAPAKINLFLHVLGRRADGYHALDSLVVFAGAVDIQTATPADGLSLTLGGPFAAALEAEADNLVLRSARLLADAAGVAPNVHLQLYKALPVASGIGGGSADAAATLRILARLWGLPGDFDLRPFAARLGADVPVCVAGRPARMMGVGDVLAPAPRLPACGIVLVNPGVPLSTAEVFRARQGTWSEAAVLPEAWDDAAAMARDLARLTNDLEPPAIRLCPV